MPLVLLNILLLLIGILRKSGAAWITFFVLLPTLFLGEMFIRFGSYTPGNQGKTLNICSYNVGMFSFQKGVSKPEQMINISNFLTKEDPDVICLQEFFAKDSSKVQSFLPHYPYRHFHLYKVKGGSLFGNLIVSKFPIQNSGAITFKRSTNLCTYADIELYGDKVRIYNTHLESHNISFTSLIKRLSKREEATKELIELHDHIAGTNVRRSYQVDSIVSHSESSEIPSIVCGDFNDTPISYTYNMLSKDRKDSFRESGNGFSATYSVLWPMLRIDYILFPTIWWSAQHRTVKKPYSDHYPIFAEIIIPTHKTND